MREPNILLDAIIDEARMSHDGLAARVNRLGVRDGLVLLYDHASVRRWIRDGTSPRGRVPELICEVLGARLGRSVMLADIGMERLAGQPTGDGSLGRIVDHATPCGTAISSRLRRFEPPRRCGGRPRSPRCLNGRTRRMILTWHGARGARLMSLRSVSCGRREPGMSTCTERPGGSRYARGSWRS